MLNARIKEYGLDKVLEAIENIRYSRFLKGQNNKNWTITFDWLIKPNNFTKVLEGNYRDKGDSNNGALNRILSQVRKNQNTTSTVTNSYKCDKCKDTTWLLNDEGRL